MEDFIYKVNDIDYQVHIINKKVKNIYFRFRDNAFYVSCPKNTSKQHIIKYLDKYATNLVKRGNKEKAKTNEYIYLLGVKVSLKESGSIPFSDGSEITYKSQTELDKKLRKWFLELLTSRVKYYSSLMNVPLYKVAVQDMKTRLGSNSKHTKTLRFALSMMHYSIEIIDSVVVHEIAHILVYDHSKKFYDVVYKYCPNYKECRRKLIKGEFK